MFLMINFTPCSHNPLSWAVQYINCRDAVGVFYSRECPGYNTKLSDGEALRNVEYHFIAIIPRSTLTESSCTQ